MLHDSSDQLIFSICKYRRKTSNSEEFGLKQLLRDDPVSHLIRLRAGEEAGQRAAAGRQRGCERGAAVSQDGLQVAGGGAESRTVYLLH